MSSDPAPVLVSVVVPSYNAAGTIRRCLGALMRQRTDEPYETIVVDSSSDGTAATIAEEFPGVRLVTSGARLFPGSARNVGVRHARGSILAFTDADCIVPLGWIDQIVAAHRRTGHALIGGAIENANPASYVGWASYFLEFTSWMPHQPAREMIEIPTTCLTMQRTLFEAYGPFLESTYCSDSAFNWRAGQHGCRPLFLPDIRVAHVNIAGFGDFLSRKVRHGRDFARVRTSTEGWSLLKRLAYAAGTPALPAILFGRIARRAPRDGRSMARFVLASPVVLAGLIAWACGELQGYLDTEPRRDSVNV